MKIYIPSFMVPVLLFSLSCKTQQNPMVSVEEIPGQNKVEISIDGQFFTSYIWPGDMEKPVLYPLRTASGTIVTRGFPLDPRPGERVDHPHHVGHWFNYGDVNGLDFWNNSYAIPAEEKNNYGSIQLEKILKTRSGDKSGMLEVETSWRNSGNEVLLKEISQFIFSGDAAYRSIERFTTLTAMDNPVEFKDNKEGLFGIRMDRAFEFPSEKPEIFTDTQGNPTEVAVMNNEGVNGSYLSSEGIIGEDVWGTRAKWMSLSAEKDGEKISVVIIGHPDNPGYPSYWHARTYGLFAANPLGQAVFTNGEKAMNLRLNAGESVTFKYKILIKNGSFAEKDELDEFFRSFSKM